MGIDRLFIVAVVMASVLSVVFLAAVEFTLK